MQLETYIRDLLYRYECVIVPGFGAFLTQHLPATIIDSSNTFYPPKKLVSFNEQIQQNDGLLASYIAEVEKISFEAASNKVAKRVALLKSYLAQGDTLTFNNIGEVVYNKEGKIFFEPTLHVNYLTDSCGLDEFKTPKISREIVKEVVEDIEIISPIFVTPEKQRPVSNSRLYLKYAAVALIALTIGGMGASKFYVGQIQEHNQLAQKEANEQLEAQIQQATFNLNPFPAITLNVLKGNSDEQTGNYHIIAGAFRVEKNCDKKIKQLRRVGFKARKIGANKYGLHQVAYASYEDNVQALKALSDIRKNHNSSAWLYVAKLK